MKYNADGQTYTRVHTYRAPGQKLHRSVNTAVELTGEKVKGGGGNKKNII